MDRKKLNRIELLIELHLLDMEDIWTFVEDKLKAPVPAYFKSVLNVCGYSNGNSLTLNEIKKENKNNQNTSSPDRSELPSLNVEKLFPLVTSTMKLVNLDGDALKVNVKRDNLLTTKTNSIIDNHKDNHKVLKSKTISENSDETNLGGMLSNQ